MFLLVAMFCSAMTIDTCDLAVYPLPFKTVPDCSAVAQATAERLKAEAPDVLFMLQCVPMGGTSV